MNGQPDEVLRRIEARPASTMSMRSPRWLWHQRIPQSAITLLAGREGIGKSTMDAAFASDVTNGKMPGHYEGEPHSVGIVATEDTWEEVIVPRLYAARANLDRVFRIDARTEENSLETISVPKDLTALAVTAQERDIVLVIVDPLMSVIHSSLDVHNERSIRRALDPLARFAATVGVAVLGNIHVNKSETTDPLTSIMASRAFTAVARSVLFCMADPDEEKGDRFLLCHEKSNLGPRQPTIQYRIISADIEMDDGESPTIHTSKIAWGDQDSRTAREALQAKEREKMRPGTELTKRIMTILRDAGHAVSTRDLCEALDDIDPRYVRAHLSRMAKRGEISKPVHGHYTLPHPDTTATTTTTDAKAAGAAGESSKAAPAGHSREALHDDAPGLWDTDIDDTDVPDDIDEQEGDDRGA